MSTRWGFLPRFIVLGNGNFIELNSLLAKSLKYCGFGAWGGYIWQMPLQILP